MKQNLIKLTEENYYTPANEYISNSKVSDFLASKEYFYEKHVEHSIEEETTDAMDLGKMVDAVFSAGTTKALNRWRVKSGRGDNAIGEDGAIPVTETQWQKAFDMGRTLIESDWYKFYRTPGLEVSFQTILTGKIKPGSKQRTIGICGKTDVFVVDHASKTIWIDDLKTAALGAMRNAATWYFHCVEFGYFRQLFGYRLMAQQLFPSYKIITRHAVISSGKRGKYLTKLFIIPPDLLTSPGRTFIETVIAIAKEKTFKDPSISWEDAEVLERPVSARPLSQLTDQESHEE